MIPFDTPEASFLVYVFVFIGMLLAVEGVRQLFSRSETTSEARNRRMRMMKDGKSTEEVLNILTDSKSRGEQSGSIFASLRRLLMKAGVAISPFVAICIAAILGSASYVVASEFFPPEFALLQSLIVAIPLPIMVLRALSTLRLKKLTTQLPDALDLMARGLKVGHPLSVTVESVATEMSDPIGSEFGIIQDQVSYGEDVVTAFRDFANRTELEDVRYLAVTVGIQHGTGGNLGRVLRVLSKVIRDRTVMRKKIMAISSEGRLSAVILTLLPLLIFGSIHVATPSFYGDVWDDPLFLPFGAAIVGLILVQGLILYRLVNFRF